MSAPADAIFAASALSRAARFGEAIDEVATSLQAALGGRRAQVVVAYATPHHVTAYPSLARALSERLGQVPVVGSSAVGVMSSAGEGEGEPGLAALAIGGDALRASPFSAPHLATEAEVVGRRLGQSFAELPGTGRLLVVMPDAYIGSLTPFLQPLAFCYGPHPLVGGAPSEFGLGRTYQWSSDNALMTGGVSGVFLNGHFEVHVAVTQGCALTEPPLTVTESVGSVIMALNGKPALEVFTSRLPGPLREDLPRAMRTVLFARRHGDAMLAHQVIAIEADRQGLVFQEAVAQGTQVHLAIRDAMSAREDMKRQLSALKARVAGRRIAFGLYFNCAGRGAELYGLPDMDASYIGGELGDFAWIGMSSNAELASVGGVPHVFAYTGVLALVVESALTAR